MKQLTDYLYHETERGVLYCGDCLEIMPLLADKSVDLVLTDPPYGIDYLSPRTDNHIRIENDRFGDWERCLPMWLAEFKRIVVDSGCCCCCCGGGGGKTPVTALFTIEAIKHFYLIQTLVWKKHLGLGWRYRPSYENIVVLSKDKSGYAFYDESKACSNVIELINQEIPQQGEHPTKKPVDLMAKLMLVHSKPNELVIDPFAGSGTTAVACINTKRRYILIEKEEKYCQIAKKRIETILDQKEIDL